MNGPDPAPAAREGRPERGGIHDRLRDDVRLLGDLLGEILRGQEGNALFELVEKVRALAKRARSGNAEDAEALRALLASLDSAEARPLARAFAHFLALANIAEQHHRVRLRRERRRLPGARGAVAEALARSLQAGVSAERLHAVVSTMEVELVLTAHPTQAMRRTLLQKHRRIAAALASRDRADLLPDEREELSQDLRREISAIWQTDELRRQRPSPVDEARAALVLFDQVLWDALPVYLRSLDRALLDATGKPLPLDAAPIRFGSWTGGDRDGNPSVTAAVTDEVLQLARRRAAELYRREIEKLHDELSMTRASDELRARVGPAAEPYRAVLKEVLERLAATAGSSASKKEGQPLPYTHPHELWGPLALCHRSLHATGARSVADGRLLDVLRRLAAFGLTLFRLDVRQEASVHARAMDAVTRSLGLGSYLDWTEDERIAFLARELESPRSLLPRRMPEDPALAELLATLAVCARQPEGALGAYVISMARAPSDVLLVQLLQREVDLPRPLRVVPLFETLADLERAGAIIGRLLEVPWYRNHIGGHQEVMIGYSDSTKDAGRLAAAWALFRAQEEVVRVCHARDVKVTLFHGRGGTIGRGGGPIYLAVLSQPPGSVDGRLRVTVQGETIEASFGLPDIAVESFELYANATLEATLHPPPAPSAAERALMDRLASLAAGAYRRVVAGDPGFLRYFRVATPEQELGHLNIGSRPARRRPGASADLGSLRAIPWIFAWTQTRLHLPAWLGAGEALTTLAEEGAGKQLQQMARDWPFFRSLLDLFEMVLAKTDADIVAYYDRVLVPDELRPLGQDLRASCRRTIAAVLQAKGEAMLLAGQADLRRSIELRNPYVDPLNLLQAELLRRTRATDDAQLTDALLVTVNGIAAGMRNTG